MTDAIFSIRPFFAESILDGTKKVELRTVAPKKPIDRCWIYSSAPVQQIVGHFRPGAVRAATDAEVAPYIDLIGGRRCYAIEILEPTALEPAINPREMGLEYLWLAPQSFRYTGSMEQAALRGRAP